MSEPKGILEPRPARPDGALRAPAAISRIGLVVHPSRSVDRPLRELRRWADHHSVELVQVPALCAQQRVAVPGDANECDLVVSIGGDGTTLAAIRSGAAADRPVLGVACGSLGALTTVAANRVADALERFRRGAWLPRSLPALDVARASGERLFAMNDIAVVRAGEGQVRVTTHIDGVLLARFAGDGCVVSTPIGSSAYSLAARGPLLMSEADAYLLTPLAVHGGACPPAVIGAASELRLDAIPGHGGARLEVDGQVAATRVEWLTVGFRRGAATVVTFADQEPFIAGLRRRQIIADSPRILAEDEMAGRPPRGRGDPPRPSGRADHEEH
jgi:NAD+ kinase